MTVVVAAESAVLSARVEAMLRGDPRVRVVVAGPGELATLAAEPDTAILILAMSAPAAARTLDRLGSVRRAPPVILLTPAPHEAWTARARRAGVRAVLPHDATAGELSAAMAATRAGLLVVHPDAVSAPPAAAALPPGGTTTLTPRELDILEMIAEGMRNRAIAARLKISRHTVKFHVASMLTKLGARSRTEAVTAGVRQGLISL